MVKKALKKILDPKNSNLKNVLVVVVISALVSLVVNKLTIASNIRNAVEKDVDIIIKPIEKGMKEKQEKAQREAQEIATKKAPEIAKKMAESAGNPVLGNKNGSKVVVEFFDYACGHCKREAMELEKLIKEDSNIKVVLADLPILSQQSLVAAQLGVYIYKVNPKKFADYYIAVAKRNVDPASLKSIVESLGFGEDIFKKAEEDKDVRSVIEGNYEAAKELNIQGTPALLVGNKFVGGMISGNDIKAMLKRQCSWLGKILKLTRSTLPVVPCFFVV